MTQNTENNTGIPPLDEQLKIHLRESLERYGDPHHIDVLIEQTAILDRTFRHMIERGTQSSTDTQRIAAGLRAQNQYRYTVKTLEVLNKKEREEYLRNKKR